MRISQTGTWVWMVGNPVLHRVDEQLRPGGYAGFDGWPVASPSAGPAQAGGLTWDDVVRNTLGLFVVVIAACATLWLAALGNSGLRLPLLLGGILGSLALGVVIYFKDTISVPLIVSFAVLEGGFVGAVCGFFGDVYGGVIPTAVLAAVSTFAGMLLVWRLGFIRATDRFRRSVGMAIMGYLFFSLGNIVAGLVGIGDGWGFGGGLLGLAVSVGVVALTSYCLMIDFDTVERAVEAGLPQEYSWLLAHGLIVSLVWMYLEILRLLNAQLRRS